jgi:hypothetical protein
MRHRSLHDALLVFTKDVSAALAAEIAGGAEVQFELAAEGRTHRTPLYCYRPLTGAFIRERLGHPARLASYAPVARSLEELDGLDNYLRARGEARVPRAGRDRADATLRTFLDRVFADSTDFKLDDERFARAYDELEAAVVIRASVATLVVGLPGLRLESPEIQLAHGVRLAQADVVQDAPDDAAWLGAHDDEPNVLAVITLKDVLDAEAAPERLRRLVRALRLYEAGCVGLAPVAWARMDDQPWQLVALNGSPARPGVPLCIPTAQEDELRAFVALASRRMPKGGELAWALTRFDLACERDDPADALTDLLLALRALLEPEGVSSGLLAPRLAALCATAEDRDALQHRVDGAISVERATIAGLTSQTATVPDLVDELTEHLRALLGDALCGHLDADLRAAADAVLTPARA